MGDKLQSGSDFEQYALGTYQLSKEEFNRLLEDVIEFFSVTLEDFIRLRHAQLQSQGVKNREIYGRIRLELGQRRFKAPNLSERQIRRMVYG